MTSDDNWRETAVAADSVGKSEVELRAQRADTFDELVRALAVDVAKELTVLSAMAFSKPSIHNSQRMSPLRLSMANSGL